MDRRSKVLLCRWLRPHHFVIMFFFAIIAALTSAYAIAVADNYVSPLFPYISDAGTQPPSSCVFGFLLNLSAFLAFVLMYIWHGLFEQYSCLDNTRIHMANDVSCLLGVLSCVGMMLVANFQVSSVISIHMIGAMLTFVIGVIYCWIISYLSRAAIQSGFCSTRKSHVRFAITILATLFFIMTVAPIYSANTAFTNAHNTTLMNMSDYARFHWKPTDPGYQAHLVSTFGEWLMVIAFTCFFLTFYTDFKNVASSVRIISVSGGEEQMSFHSHSSTA